jgi:hypothetical protein
MASPIRPITAVLGPAIIPFVFYVISPLIILGPLGPSFGAPFPALSPTFAPFLGTLTPFLSTIAHAFETIASVSMAVAELVQSVFFISNRAQQSRDAASVGFVPVLGKLIHDLIDHVLGFVQTIASDGVVSVSNFIGSRLQSASSPAERATVRAGQIIAEFFGTLSQRRNAVLCAINQISIVLRERGRYKEKQKQ